MIPSSGLSYLKEQENSIGRPTKASTASGHGFGLAFLMRADPQQVVDLGDIFYLRRTQTHGFLDFAAGISILYVCVPERSCLFRAFSPTACPVQM